MGALDRLKLLFAGDEHLLQLNTGLRPVPETLYEPPTVAQTSKTLAEASEDIQNEQLLAESTAETGSEPTDQPIPAPYSTDPMPHDGVFCPLTAISRFPYRHIRGELMQSVASQLFDKGHFWDRSWDLYYIHVPSGVGTNHLLLVPANQVQKLFREINNALDCTLSLPMDPEKGLVLDFRKEGFPQPTYLGHSSNRSTKEYLDSKVPRAPTRDDRAIGMDEQYIAFEKMMEAACAASKSKNKAGKVNKQRLRLQRGIEIAEGLKRAEAYLGLRSLESFSDQPEIIENKWDQEQALDPQLPRLAIDKPAPYPFWKTPVLISIDVEANEICHTQVTEVGISTLDTRDLVGVSPGPQGAQWRSCILSRHLRMSEHRHHVNRKFVAGCPDKFQFGTSEWVSEKEIASVVQTCFSQPSFFDGEGAEKHLRPLVVVGHSLSNDIEYFQTLGLQETETSGMLGIADRIDTAELFREVRGEPEPRSLGGVLAELEITGWYLHNAGNDARYTMEALVGMLVAKEMS